MDEAFKGFATVDSASRISLNESNLPKHRKKRFQQVNVLIFMHISDNSHCSIIQRNNYNYNLL